MYRFSLLVSFCVCIGELSFWLRSVRSGEIIRKETFWFLFFFSFPMYIVLCPEAGRDKSVTLNEAFWRVACARCDGPSDCFPLLWRVWVSWREREREFQEIAFSFFFFSFLFLLIFLSLDGWLASVTCLESPRRMNHERWPSGRAVISCRNYCFSLLLLQQEIPHIPDALENSRSSFLFLSPWLRRATIRTATLQTRIFVRVRIYAFWVDGHISRSGFVPDGVSPSFISFFPSSCLWYFSSK